MAQTNNVIIPGGCLQNTKISLKCKAPDEKLLYCFSMANQFLANEEIQAVIGQPPANSGVEITNYTTNVNTFNCMISGGRIPFDVGIRFIVTTKQGTRYSFVCVLPIRQQGTLLDNDSCGMGVLDNSSPTGTITVNSTITGLPGAEALVENVGTPTAAFLNFTIPRGAEGKAATIRVGKVTNGENGSQAEVSNSGDSLNAVFDFVLPSGADGEVQTVKIGETKTLPAGYAATVEATTKDNVVTLTFGIPSGYTGEAGQYLLKIGDIKTLAPTEQATASITDDGKGNHSLNLGIPQGKKGNDGISPTLSIGTVTTLDPGENSTASIVNNPDGKDVLNLGIVKGPKGESYVNNGTTNLDICSLKLATIKDVNIDDVDDHFIVLDNKNNQLLIKKNNKWEPLNMNNNTFEIKTSYKNNNGTSLIKFAPDKITLSSDGASGVDGVTAGYLSFPSVPIATPTPTTLEVRTTFKLTTTKDVDYYISGYNNDINIRVNPNKHIISVYSDNATKSYDIDYTTLGLNLADNQPHVLSLFLNAANNGFVSFSIDGVFFNKNYTSSSNFYMAAIRIRGTENITVPENEVIVKDIALSTKPPTRINNSQSYSYYINNSVLFSYDGWYKCQNNVFTNEQLINGILLKPTSFFDSFNSIMPYYLNNSIVNNQSLFNDDGLYSGILSFNSTEIIPTFTLELNFKFNSKYNTPSIRRPIVGNYHNMYSIGLTKDSQNKLTIKYHVNPDTEFTLLDAVSFDQWHTLAISTNNNLMNIFIDGVLVHTKNFETNFQNFYFRSLDYNNYITDPNCLVIKNVSLLIGQAKYYKDYDISMLPITPTDFNSNGYFYPLVNGRIENENETSPIIKILLNETDSLKVKTVPYGKSMNLFASYPVISFNKNNPPPNFDTKGASVYILNVTGSILKETI